LADCSHWPEHAGCGQQCLQQIEKSPQNCLVRNILLQWYQGKNCAWCGTPIGDIHLAERKPALMTPDRVSLEWADIPAERLQQTLAIALPLCFGCHIVNTMVRKHPELVIDRARPMTRGTSHSPRTGSRLAESRPRNQHQPDNLVGVVTREDDTVRVAYRSHTEPQQVLWESKRPGSNVENLSLIGWGSRRRNSGAGYHGVGGRMKYWGRFAAFWSLACVVALGAALFLVPGVRPTLQAGAFTSGTLGLVEGIILVVGFLTLLLAGLYSLGIPEKCTSTYDPKVHSVQPPSGQSTAPTTIKAA
jgi:hypothetical protein